MALTDVSFLVADDAIPANDLEDVVVRVFSEDGSTFITQGTTNSAGELTLDLEDDTTYWVRFFKVGYAAAPQLLIDVQPGSGAVFYVQLDNLTVLPPSTVPYLCRVSGYVRGADFAPRGGLRVTFSLTGRPRVVAGEVLVVQDVIAVSDQRGWVEVELVRNAVYDCVVDGLDDVVYRVVVPDRTSVKLTELVWPYVAVLVYSEDDEEVDSVSLPVGGTVQLNATVTLSCGVTTPYELDGGAELHAGNFVQLTVSDASIVRATLDGDVLTLVGLAAGSATITASVVEDVETDRLPVPDRDLADLVVVVSV